MSASNATARACMPKHARGFSKSSPASRILTKFQPTAKSPLTLANCRRKRRRRKSSFTWRGKVSSEQPRNRFKSADAATVMDLLIKSLGGFFVGTLIGMKGVGGGVLLLPILIFGLHVPAIAPVGSEALFNFFAKIGARFVRTAR